MRRASEKSMFWVGVTFTAILIATLLGGVWAFLDHRHYFSEGIRTKRCQVMLDALETAKKDYLADYHLPESADLTFEEVITYLEPGTALRACPSGGLITVNRIGTPATCSVHSQQAP